MTAPRLNIEFVSAYPTHPLSGEDAYAAIVGDVLARLYAHLGWSVTREYLVNDTGPQIDALARAVFAQLARETPPKDENLAALAEELPAPLCKAALAATDEADWLPALRAATLSLMMRKIRQELSSLGIYFDAFTSETALHLETRLPPLLSALSTRGLLSADARAELDTPRAGDTHKRALTTADGGATYFAADLVYHEDKLSRGYDRLITILRHDHAAYAPGIRAATSLLSGGKVPLHTNVLSPVRPSDPATPPPALSTLLEHLTPTLLRHLLLSEHESFTLPPSPTHIKALEQAEAQQRAALSLPKAPAEAFDLETLLDQAAQDTTPLPLLKAANQITAEALAAGRISPETHTALMTLRQIIGIPEKDHPNE